MISEKHKINNNLVSIYNQSTNEAETIKGRNGRPLFDAWSKIPYDAEDDSRADIARSYRLGRGF